MYMKGQEKHSFGLLKSDEVINKLKLRGQLSCHFDGKVRRSLPVTNKTRCVTYENQKPI